MPFCPHDMHMMDPVSLTFASAGIMVGSQDPMMGFPPGTRFVPYAVVRNTTPAPIKLSPVLNYMAGSAPVTRPLHAETLAPFEARQLGLTAMMQALGLSNFNGSINLALNYTGRPGEVQVATGSVGQTGNYVFEVDPEGLGQSLSKEASYWSVADGFDTMFSVWNPISTAEDLTVTFYYADGSGKYTLPVHLDGNASAMIDIMKLKMSGQPDQDGHQFSDTALQGSAVFANAQGYTKPITAVVGVGTFNAQTATCCTNKVNCCGYSNFSVTPVGWSCPIGASMQCDDRATYCDGSIQTFTSTSSWSSSNTSVATVSSGTVSGSAAGSVTISAKFPSLVSFTGTLCPPQTCPQGSNGASGPATFTTPTPSQHTYPNSPLQSGCYVGTPFDAPIGGGKTHNAQDLKSSGIAIGTPVYAAESGQVTAVFSTATHDPQSEVLVNGIPACAGKGDSTNYVEITGADNAITRYYHTHPTVTKGQSVTAGQQIGTVDTSGCSSGPHVHMQRKANGSMVNFVVTGCAPNPPKYDLANTWYDDGPFSF